MKASSVAIIDYGMGNLHSVASALSHISPKIQVNITAEAQVIENADHVIFPGVGAIRDCMAEIRRLGFDTLVPKIIASGKPVLGICVGMQALLETSEENNGIDCLGVLKGSVKFFGENLKDENSQTLKVPHMGWNNVEQTREHPLWHKIDSGSRFYFVHSYCVQSDTATQVAGTCHYGIPFSAALMRDNLFATQFHPEKSDTAGLKLLTNFLNWDGNC